MAAVLITSASRGIGLEFARQYAEDGWQVFAACRDPASAAKLEPIVKAAKGNVQVLRSDVTDAEGIRQAAKQVGEQPIDVLVNSAGIMGGGGQRLGDMDYGSWSEVLDINTLGPMRVTEAFFEHLRRSQRKIVVTITSGMGSL